MSDIIKRLNEMASHLSIDWTYAKAMADAAAEIERLRVADGMLRHGIRQLELDLSVKTTEAERLHAEIGRRIQDKRESDGRVLAALEIDERQRAEIERLRASEAQAIDDADALCEWLRYYDYPSCRFTTVVGAAIKPACMRALDRRAKKEASDAH